jgi:hypothetical protein
MRQNPYAIRDIAIYPVRTRQTVSLTKTPTGAQGDRFFRVEQAAPSWLRLVARVRAGGLSAPGWLAAG